MKIAIIGTAGRGSDYDRLRGKTWNLMLQTALNFIEEFDSPTLVSGGAAWADHLAVELFQGGHAPFLELHLPAPWNEQAKEYQRDGRFSAGSIANYYHYQFSRRRNPQDPHWSLHRLHHAMQRKACSVFTWGGFKERNTEVAKADVVLAFTFGDGRTLKDGGTADTVRKFIAREGPENAFHVDLHTGFLYQHARA